MTNTKCDEEAKAMTKEEALEKLRREFHRTRTTWSVSVDPEIIAAILEYPWRPMSYDDRKRKVGGE